MYMLSTNICDLVPIFIIQGKNCKIISKVVALLDRRSV